MSDHIRRRQRELILRAMQRRAIERHDQSLNLFVGYWQARLRNLLPDVGGAFELTFDAKVHAHLWSRYGTANVIECDITSDAHNLIIILS